MLSQVLLIMILFLCFILLSSDKQLPFDGPITEGKVVASSQCNNR